MIHAARFGEFQEKFDISNGFLKYRAWHDPWLRENATIKPGG